MNKRYTLKDIVENYARQSGISVRKSDILVKTLFETIEASLEQDGYAKVKHLGTFKLVSVSPRQSIDVNTGEPIQIDSHSKVTFTPDDFIKDIVNRPFAHFQTVALNDEVDIKELEKVETPELETEKEPVTAETVAPLVTEEIDENKAEVNTDIPETEPTEAVEEIETIQPAEIEAESISEPEIKDEEITETTVNEVEEDIVEPTENTAATTPTTPPPPPLSPLAMPEENKSEEEEVSIINETKETEEEEIDLPATLDDDEPEEKKPRSFLLYACLLIAALAIIVLSYMAGYNKIFTSDDTAKGAQNQNARTENKTASPTEKSDNDVNVARVPSPPTAPDALPSQAKHENSASPSVEADGNQAIKGAQILPPGRYVIVGTRQNYTIQKGETMMIIAKKMYGAESFAQYINKHNHITRPDNVEAGQILKLPELELKKE